MKTSIGPFFILLLACLICTSCQVKHYDQNSATIDAQLDEFSQTHKEEFFTRMYNENDTVDIATNCYSFSSDSILLSDLLDTDYKFVIYISQFTCLECFNELIEILSPIISSNNNRIMVLGSYPDIRTLYMLFNNQHFECEVYNVPVRSLGVQFEESSSITLFIMNKNGVIDMFYQPIKGDRIATKAYIEIINSRFLI